MIRLLLISGGTVSLALGILGIFIPVLPTTPFVILSTALFLKSSPALYNRVIHGRLTARYLTPQSRKRTGYYALTVMWLMIIMSVIFLTEQTLIRFLLIAVGVTGTLFKIFYFFRTSNKSK
ncbi:MAG: YbaN family protein [Bacteroidales bacterium]